MDLGIRRAASRVFVLLLTLVLGAGLLVPGAIPARAQEEPETSATVRIVHASAGSPNVDVLVDGQPLAQNVPFGTVTDYVPLPVGEHQFQVVPTGQAADNAIIEEDLDAEAGRAYIFAALGPLNEIEGKTFEVNLDRIEDARSRVRVIHLSPDADDVSVSVTGGDELFGGVSFADASDYTDVDPGTYSLDVRGGEDDRVLLTVPDLTFLAGRVYDVLALGQLGDQSLQLLSLVTNVSRPCGEVLGLDGGVGDACVRIVHASPGSPDVDVYVNDSILAQGLAFGTATEFLPLPSGDDRAVQVTAAGSEPDNAVIDTELDLTPGQAYQITATGTLEEIEGTVNEVDLSPLPENQSRIRLLHASPDAGGIDVGISGGELIFEGVDFRDASDYLTTDAGALTLEVHEAGEDSVVLRSDVELEAGMAYDAIAIGRAEDRTLALLVLASPAGSREGGLATPGSEALMTPSAVATVTSVSGGTDDDETDALETGEAAAETAAANDDAAPTPTAIS